MIATGARNPIILSIKLFIWHKFKKILLSTYNNRVHAVALNSGIKRRGHTVTLSNDKAVGGSIAMTSVKIGQTAVLCLQVNPTLKIFSPQPFG
jgi:hypothetical protein